jgi:hypothetical protein
VNVTNLKVKTMTKKELIEALQASDEDDNIEVYMMGYKILDMCISEYGVIKYIDLQDYKV